MKAEFERQEFQQNQWLLQQKQGLLKKVAQVDKQRRTSRQELSTINQRKFQTSQEAFKLQSERRDSLRASVEQKGAVVAQRLQSNQLRLTHNLEAVSERKRLRI